MKKLKYGLIGCGDISQKRVAPAIRELENCELVAVNRARYELAEEFAQEFGTQCWNKTWRVFIDDSDVEAVYMATRAQPQYVTAWKGAKHAESLILGGK